MDRIVSIHSNNLAASFMFPLSPLGLGCQGLFSFVEFIMVHTNQKRYYTPQFSGLAAVSVRRLAWSLGLSMPKAVDQVVGLLPSLFASGQVCPACKDRSKCMLCAFSQQSAAAPAVRAV
jgi:hypothetical protein